MLGAVLLIIKLGAAAIGMLQLYKSMRDNWKADNPSEPDQFLTDEMLVAESRRASQNTVETVDEIMKRHGLA